MPELPELKEPLDEWWQSVPPTGGMVTRYFCIVEGVDEDGDRFIDWVWSPGLKSWEMKGFLKEAQDNQVETTIVSGLVGED